MPKLKNWMNNNKKLREIVKAKKEEIHKKAVAFGGNHQSWQRARAKADRELNLHRQFYELQAEAYPYTVVALFLKRTNSENNVPLFFDTNEIPLYLIEDFAKRLLFATIYFPWELVQSSTNLMLKEVITKKKEELEKKGDRINAPKGKLAPWELLYEDAKKELDRAGILELPSVTRPRKS